MVYGKHQLPIWAILTHVFLPPFNALYYGKQAVANYAIHYITKLLAQAKCGTAPPSDTATATAYR